MIKTNWLDDVAATRLLKVMENNSCDVRCAVNVLCSIVDEYFTAMNQDSQTDVTRRLALNYDAVSSQLLLVRNVLFDFERDLNAAYEGHDDWVESEREYLNAITRGIENV